MSAENYESLCDHEKRIKELEKIIAYLFEEVHMIKVRERERNE